MAKKYTVITKIGNFLDGSANCVKYNCSDLISYSAFLDKKFPTWTWTNVYDRKTTERLGSFTCKSKPTQKQPF